jgi:glycosyltransferase involved in cell wall biosynthesis
VKVAYLTSQYPKTSHTFIRREIAGVERAGVEVERISVRAAGADLVDESDLAERRRTRVLLDRGVPGLLPATLATLVRRPRRAIRALTTAIAMGRRSPRGVARHIAYFAEACVLLDWSTRLGIEHVHAHFATNPTDVALLCRELGGPPFSFTAHGTSDLGSAEPGALTRKLEAASFAVAVCDDGRRKLLAHELGGRETEIHVVRCGVDRAFHAKTRSPVPEAPRLVCVARLSREKALAVLVRAARLLADEGLEFELAILGDGPERTRLERLVRELALDDFVRFEGWSSGDAVREAVLRARALVLPSLSEGLPVVIMEAFALRRPVIATRVGGIPELVETGVSGWIVDPGSDRSLRDAMREALQRPARELDAMGERGAQRVLVAHDADAQAKRLARLFELSSDRLDVGRDTLRKTFTQPSIPGMRSDEQAIPVADSTTPQN